MPISLNTAPKAASVGGVGTTAKIFPAAVQAGFIPAAPTVAAVLAVWGGGRFEQISFSATASGAITVGPTAAPTITLSLYSGTSLIPGSNTLIAASAAQAVTLSTSFNYMLYADFIGDSKSGKLTGVFEYILNGVYTARAATAILSGVNFNPVGAGGLQIADTGKAALNLVLGVTFGVSDALNTAALAQFVLDAD